MTGAPSKNVSATISPTSSFTSSIHSASTRSDFVITTIPFCILNSFSMEKCSLVWGMIPSSAATTSSTRSIPPIPASMFFTNFSCPGTSIIPMRSPSSCSSWANPSSMVIPRFCSSFNRSVLTPVNALIRHVFPWSTCPAVPTMIFLIFFHHLFPVLQTPAQSINASSSFHMVLISKWTRSWNTRTIMGTGPPLSALPISSARNRSL